MENTQNFPRPNQPSVIATPGVSFNPNADKTTGYSDHRGDNASKGGANYSGGPGTGVVAPKNTAPTS